MYARMRVCLYVHLCLFVCAYVHECISVSHVCVCMYISVTYANMHALMPRVHMFVCIIMSINMSTCSMASIQADRPASSTANIVYDVPFNLGWQYKIAQ